jgi:plasmid stabilization system protein ParE
LRKNEEIKSVCKVEVSPFAQIDLDEIFAYLAEKNYDAAIKFFEALGKTFRLLSENPKLGRQRDNYPVGMRSFPHKNYIIFYFPIETA